MSRYLAEIYLFTTIVVLIALLFLLKPAVMPFFIASTVAYLFHPLFGFFKKSFKGNVKLAAASTLAAIGLVIFITLFIILPTIFEQVQSFITYLPTLMQKLDTVIYKTFGEHLLKRFHFNAEGFHEIIKELYSKLGNLPIGNLLSKLFSGVFSILSILINLFVIPFLTYYFLTTGDKVLELYIKTAPKRIQAELKALIDKVHSSLSSYLLGQVAVAVFVGVYLSVGLWLVKIKYALLIGFIAGVLNMIPYVGFFSGLIPSLLLAAFDNGTWSAVIGVLIVFLTEVGLENLIYPLVMSRTTGINPILILLATFVGGYAGGFLGIVIAVPVAVMAVPIFESFLEKKEGSIATGGNG
ncbi:AI-2E family transporter [Thermovibrio ammonificans]